MSGTYVEVPAEAIRGRLRAAGFRLLESNEEGGLAFEEVWARDHVITGYRVKVYTSIPRHTARVRGRGKDAIRVVATMVDASGREVGIFKATRVHRSGSVDAVLERMIQRARDAYHACNVSIRKRGLR